MAQSPAPQRARKRFGQNFLRDDAVIERIVRSIHPLPGDRLVEIGPGQGALSEALLEAHGALDAIELDRDLLSGLRARFFNYPDFRLHEGDALTFDFDMLRGGGPALRVVGNLPYNISTPLIFHLIGYGTAIGDMHFMLQREVVQRLAAEPGSSQRGRLSVMAQYHCQIVALFDVPPQAFVPQPKVDSSIVRLVPWREKPHVAHDEFRLGELVRRAFSQRRKTLRNNLKGWIDGDQLTALGIEPGRRPETLSVAEFVRLANHMTDSAHKVFRR